MWSRKMGGGVSGCFEDPSRVGGQAPCRADGRSLWTSLEAQRLTLVPLQELKAPFLARELRSTIAGGVAK